MKKCRICGCAVPSGTKLCKDCAAARKRAFAATVTQPLMLAAAGAPSVSQPRFAPKPARRKLGPPPVKTPSPPSSDPRLMSPAISPLLPKPAAAERRTVAAVRRSPARRSGTAWLFGAAIAGLIVLMVLGMLAARRTHGTNDEVAPLPAAPPIPAAPSEAQPVAPTTTPSAGLNADGLVPQPVPLPAARKAPRKLPAPAESVKSLPPEPEPVVVVEPPRPAPPPPRAAPPVRVDPLQGLNDALTRCSREDLLDRMSCEQDARSRFCGDSWGQVPQCPIGRGNDHGQ
jgi:hypothetical protein